MPYSSYSSLSNQLHKEFGTQTWFNELSGYLLLRYGPIERRMLEASRYVEIYPDNKKAFSYEFSSIVRDIGSVFGSLMQHLLEKTASGNKEYTIDDFTKFLIDKVKDIELIGLSLQIPFNIISFYLLRVSKAECLQKPSYCGGNLTTTSSIQT